ncbi:hypothetical protein [Teredinibacter haidensis]|uniref:hypothetical protein n=1 Tax=Teredinibacter haidensis TaxID=2731755 RepID=UPI0009490EB1|nr:hypothetical protein [Teredinibacter haidensis]
MANFFTTLFSAGASNLVDAVGEAIDKTITSDEERKELENELAKASMHYDLETSKLGLEERKAELVDTASARENQSRIQESVNASWLSKNIHPILALGIIGLTFFMYFWIIYRGWGAIEGTGMKEIIIYILGALTTVSTQVAAFFFGSSQGSKDKQKALSDIANRLPR